MSGLFPQLPVFLDLAGRPVALLSGQADVAELARLLVSAGAGLTVFDPAPDAAIETLSLRLKRRRWRSADLRGAALVVAGAGEPRAQRARAAAHGADAMFYMLGAPELSDIVLGGALARGPLAVGFAAQGMPPSLELALRARMETALPSGVADFLAAAMALAPMVSARLPDTPSQARFWEHVSTEAFAAPRSDWRAWLERALHDASAPAQ